MAHSNFVTDAEMGLRSGGGERKYQKRQKGKECVHLIFTKANTAFTGGDAVTEVHSRADTLILPLSLPPSLVLARATASKPLHYR